MPETWQATAELCHIGDSMTRLVGVVDNCNTSEAHHSCLTHFALCGGGGCGTHHAGISITKNDDHM